MKQQFFLVLALFTILGFALGCGSSDKPTTSSTTSTSSPMKVTGQPTTTPSGLQYWDIVVGTGATATFWKHGQGSLFRLSHIRPEI